MSSSSDSSPSGEPPKASPAQPKSGARLIQLDVLRGVAILMVLACHFSTRTKLPGAGALQIVHTTFMRLDAPGVDLFFVLSGFLVGGLLFGEIRARGSLDVKRFLIRRAFKIWPLYYLYVFAMMAMTGFKKNSFSAAFHDWWPSLIHIQNYFLDRPHDHLWSLALEEHFYLALPLLLALAVAYIARKGTSDDNTPLGARTISAIPALPWIAFSVIAFCIVSRWIVCSQIFAPVPRTVDGEFYRYIYMSTHLRLDSLFFGVLLAYWHHFEPQRLHFATRHAGKLCLFGAIAISPMLYLHFSHGPFVSVIGYTLLYLGYGAILLALVYTAPSTSGNAIARFLTGKPTRALAFIGTFSYPIYLWHQYMATFVVRALVRRGVGEDLPLEVRWFLLFALDVALAVLAGMFWAKILEKPSLALRDRLFPRLSPGALEQSQTPKNQNTGTQVAATQ